MKLASPWCIHALGVILSWSVRLEVGDLLSEDPCPDTSCRYMFEHLDLDNSMTWSAFLQTLKDKGYARPKWKNLWRRSPLEDLIELLQTPVDDSLLRSYAEKVKLKLSELYNNPSRHATAQKFDTELNKLWKAVVELQGKFHLPLNVSEQKAIACPTLPCNVETPECNPYELMDSDEEHKKEWNTQVLVLRAKYHGVDFQWHWLPVSDPKINLTSVTQKMQTHGVITETNKQATVELCLHDRVNHMDVIRMELRVPTGDVKLEWFSRSACTEKGGPLMDWLLSFLGKNGYKRIYLEDDSRKTCIADGEEEEFPLRVAYMLNAKTPAEGESFYESRGFRFVDDPAKYQRSKEVFNMPVKALKFLLDCGEEYEVARAIIKKDPGEEGETVFQWLKRKNHQLQHGSSRACYDFSHITQIFWHGLSPAHQQEDPRKEDCHMVHRDPFHEEMLLFSQRWPLLKFGQNLSG